MGRQNLAPLRVHKAVTQILKTSPNSTPPPWYDAVAAVPPPSRLTRPLLQRSQIPGKKKASRMFMPLALKYEEDDLRWEYFNDHPWELARPRMVLENDGKDAQRWDWSIPLDHALNRPAPGKVDDVGNRQDEQWDRVRKSQNGRPINGESVVQRQAHLMSAGHDTDSAYNIARKEFYRVRHAQEIEERVAREEALSTGAFFGPGPLEVGMQLEDQKYEEWKKWAAREIMAMKQQQASAYSGPEEAEGQGEVCEGQMEVAEVQDSRVRVDA
ncbi:hypothetical protein K470DRAFT_254372 [Piedraia hortae CBS 480.64]|uniref:Small ribosomal subunit protein mS23 n=1 Tax=Piedraia hortae CBS 480.64 TaxID=1314780 RepID=A0A6A7C8Z9_9PEZI|nr:hypothetical protein K470DRAFT_254372 [Piedraia hortae CBS 480.64]